MEADHSYVDGIRKGYLRKCQQEAQPEVVREGISCKGYGMSKSQKMKTVLRLKSSTLRGVI